MAQQYLIIGAGVAGVSAAEAIAQNDPGGQITLIGEETHDFYSRPGLAYYLTGELPERQLFLPQVKPFQRITAKTIAIETEARQVILEDGRRQSYERLLIAVGSSALMPAMPGADLKGVVKLDTLDDVRHILKLARRGKTAVAVGGGITALELVEGLRARRMKVHYLLRGDRYWRNVLDETESRIVEQRLTDEGVQLHHHTQLTQIVGQRGRVVGVQTADNHRLKCNLVAIAVGVRPRLELAQQAGLRVDRGILTNEYLQTNIPDIFAAGDVAQVYYPLTNQTVLDTLWSTARAQGRAAGLNMTGQRAPYQKEVPCNVTRLAGLTTTIIGAVGRGADDDLQSIARGDSETWRQLPDAGAAQSAFEVNRLRLVLGDRAILGAVVMGDQSLSRPLQALIAQQVDISPVRAQLLAPQAPLNDLLTDFWLNWRKHYAPSQL